MNNCIKKKELKKIRVAVNGDQCTKTVSPEWGSIIVNAMINEYNTMRKESLNKLQFQVTLITFYITSMATILSIFIKQSETEDNYLNRASIFSFVIPCVTIYVAIIWLDQVYRQKKIAYFTYNLENKINRFILDNSGVATTAIYWEHWISTSKADTWKFTVKLTFYYICLGTLTIVPIVSFICGMAIVDCDSSKIQIQVYIVPVLYAIYVLLVIIYIINIKKLDTSNTL